jgi:hypothetical protein
MTLRQGKFYNGDTLVPLEFGNKEQIALLQRVDYLREEGEFLDLDFDISKSGHKIIGASYGLECVCGSMVKFKDREFEVKGKQKCSCGLKYEARTEDGLFIAYLI